MDLSDLAGILGDPDAEPRTSLCALADTLSELSAYVFSVASGETGDAGEFLREASLASADAYPLGSPESERVGRIITDVLELAAAGMPS